MCVRTLELDKDWKCSCNFSVPQSCFCLLAYFDFGSRGRILPLCVCSD